jgi:hypothetical protein
MGASVENEYPDPELIGTTEEFWATVDFLRKRRGLSLRQLGEMAAVPFNTIGGYLRGASQPRQNSCREVRRIIEAVGVTDPVVREAWVAAHLRLRGVVPPRRGATVRTPRPAGLRPGIEQLGREPRLRGRAAMLDDLQNRLLGRPGGPGRGAMRVHVLHGMPGTGKSTLALHLAMRAMARQVTTWWANGSDPAVFAADMYALAVELGVSAHRLRHGSAIDAVWEVLENRRPWLLIIDDLNDPQRVLASEGRPIGDAAGWLRPVRGPHGAVLITSRKGGDEVWRTGAPGVSAHGRPWIAMHRVPPLTPASGAEVLADLAGPRAGGTADAVELAERLGGLPSALKHAGLYLARAHHTPAPLVDPQTARTYAEYQAALAEGRYPHLRDIWELSLNLLDSQELPEARQLLRLLACFGAGPVPYDLLRPEILAASQLFAGLRGGRLWDLLRALGDLGLVDLSDERGILLQPMVHATTRRHPDINAGHVRLVAALLNAAAGDDPRDPENWPRWRTLVAHCGAPLDLLGLLPEPGDVPDPVRPLALTAGYLRASGQLSHAECVLKSGLERARELLPTEDPGLLSLEHELARVVYGLGRTAEAEALLRQVTAARSRVLGEHAPDTLTSRHYMGRIMQDLGRLGEAQAVFEETLRHRRRVLGPGHRDTLTTMNNLGAVLLRRGRTAEAERIFTEVLAGRTRLMGADHPATLITRYHLAVLYRRTNRLDTAEASLRSLCDDSGRVQGSAHPRTLVAQRLLAEVLAVRDHRSDAVDLLSNVLLSQSETLGKEHPATVETHSLLTALS